MTTKSLQETIKLAESVCPYSTRDQDASDLLNYSALGKLFTIKRECHHPILIKLCNTPIVRNPGLKSFEIDKDINSVAFCPICRDYCEYDILINTEAKCAFIYLAIWFLPPKEYSDDTPHAPYDPGRNHIFPNRDIMRFAYVKYTDLIYSKAINLILNADPNYTLDELQEYLQNEIQKYLETDIIRDATDPTQEMPPLPLDYIEKYIIVKDPIKQIKSQSLTRGK